MKGELKAGGLAIIIHSSIPENIGKVVKLIEFVGSRRHVIHSGRNDLWKVTAESKGIVGSISVIEVGAPGIVPGAWLMPIDGDDFKDDEREVHNAPKYPAEINH